MAAAVIAAAIYFFYDPSQPGNWFPRCTFLTLTGYKCPGCGSQRAIHSLLHGDVLQAFRYNAALLVMIPLLATYLLAEWKRDDWQHFYNALNSAAAGIIVVIAVIAWWLLRNIFGW